MAWNGRACRKLLGRLPARIQIVAGGLFVAFWLAAAVTAFQHPGRTEVRDGQFLLYGRDTFLPTVVDRATYERYTMSGDVIMLCVLGAFGVVGATASAGLARPDEEPDRWAEPDSG